jgi:beta-glucosidase
VAVVGALSDAENLGDTGSSASYPSSVVTPLEGIEALAQARGVTVDALATDTLDAAAVSIVGAADVAVVVVGLTADDEGEYIPLFPGGADREILTLSAEQVALIEQVEAVQPHTVVLVEGGSAVVMDPWITQVPAAMMIWYPGQSGGTAIAEALWGDINPSGKMPLSVPTDGAMLPVFDNVSAEVTYTELHGYWHLEAVGAQPRFAFGHGESYTTFALSDVSAPSSVDGDATSLTVTLNVTNTGGVAGAEVVQVYGRADDSAWTRPLHRLVGFARVELAAGATSTVEVVLDLDMLRHWDETAGTLTLEDTTYTLEVGTASDDLPLQTTLTLD